MDLENIYIAGTIEFVVDVTETFNQLSISLVEDPEQEKIISKPAAVSFEIDTPGSYTFRFKYEKVMGGEKQQWTQGPILHIL